jgi:beta-lactamase superfamily II metal-dependent hydrolase
MSIIKSFSVGNGDMFYIEHGSDNFSIIDCNLNDDRKEEIMDEICEIGGKKGIMRFISTHPDEDHFHGIEYFDDRFRIYNFYCVKNNAIKSDESASFEHYCSLRDDTKKAFYIYKGCRRKWMNDSSEERDCSGINILWPDTENSEFKEQLEIVNDGGNANNISPIIKYSLENGVVALWFGDLETEFMDTIVDEISFPEADIIFAPHHGRSSGKLPYDWLAAIDPKIIVIGEADSTMLDYYNGYNTITQNSAEDIAFNGSVRYFL